MEFKEKFDKGVHIEVLLETLKRYNRELDDLIKIIPSQVLERGNLLKHSGWLKHYLYKGLPDSCYQDIADICMFDIFYVEETYFHYLTESDDKNENLLNWNIIHQVIHKVAKPRFDQKLYSDAVMVSYKELNNTIKQDYFKLENKELDGAQLMRTVFATNLKNDFDPVYKLVENKSSKGRNIQDG